MVNASMAHICHFPAPTIATNTVCVIILPVRDRRTLPSASVRDNYCVKDDVAEAVSLANLRLQHGTLTQAFLPHRTVWYSGKAANCGLSNNPLRRDPSCSSLVLKHRQNTATVMGERHVKLWHWLFASILMAVIVLWLSWPNSNQKASIADWQFESGMGPDLMTQQGTQNPARLEEQISKAINNGEWTELSAPRPLLRAVTECSSAGCKTTFYDGDGI